VIYIQTKCDIKQIQAQVLYNIQTQVRYKTYKL
jgi:hypothetical protein